MHHLFQMLTFVSGECGKRSRTPPRPGLVKVYSDRSRGQTLLTSRKLLVLHFSDSVLLRPVCRDKIGEDVPSQIKPKSTQFLTIHSAGHITYVIFIFQKDYTNLLFNMLTTVQ